MALTIHDLFVITGQAERRPGDLLSSRAFIPRSEQGCRPLLDTRICASLVRA